MIAWSYHGRNPEGFTGSAGIMHSVIARFSAASLVEKKEMPAPRKATTVQAAPTPAAVAVPVQNPAPSASPANRYAVIVGAFRVEENANKLVSELRSKGVDASIFDRSKTGLYRVTVGAFPDREEACRLLASTRSDAFSGAWLLIK
jgi:cell division septation protein DedD